MNRRPSISDVAAEAEVSIATVSLALRDKGRMSEKTRVRVKEVAAEMGYAANINARSLVGGQTRLIAMAMPGIGSEPEKVGSDRYFFRLLGAAAARALEFSYSLVVIPPSQRSDRVAVDGAVVVDPSFEDPTIEAFDRRGQPVVTVGRRVDHSNAPTGENLVVDNDYEAATNRMLDHLMDRGADSIMLLAAEPIDSFQKDSIDAYRAWCAMNHLDPRVAIAKSRSAGDFDSTIETVLSGSARPDAIHATLDDMADRLLDRATSAGLGVPSDLRISTVSDSLGSRASTPPLTVIDEKPDQLGEAAVSLLIDAIEERESGPAYVQIGTELIPRESTA